MIGPQGRNGGRALLWGNDEDNKRRHSLSTFFMSI